MREREVVELFNKVEHRIVSLCLNVGLGNHQQTTPQGVVRILCEIARSSHEFGELEVLFASRHFPNTEQLLDQLIADYLNLINNNLSEFSASVTLNNFRRKAKKKKTKLIL